MFRYINKTNKFRFIICLWFVSLFTFADSQVITIAAPSLSNATIKTAGQQSLFIYLPDSYSLSKKNYPVMYYLHGYGGNVKEASFITKALERYILADKAQEMIVVSINGNNKFGGSFYANSPITGNWRDFVTKDVIEYVDNNYRTLAQADYRGIVGYSMGGYGAINIALKHPDKFKHLFSLSPGLFDKNGLDQATSQWKNEGWNTFMNGYAATFAAKTSGGSYWYDWDKNSTSVRAKWSTGFGDLSKKINDYLQLPNRLTSIHIEYGKKDRFTWIPQGSRYFVKLLTDKAIEVDEVVHAKGHDIGFAQADHINNFFSLSFSAIETNKQ